MSTVFNNRITQLTLEIARLNDERTGLYILWSHKVIISYWVIIFCLIFDAGVMSALAAQRTGLLATDSNLFRLMEDGLMEGERNLLQLEMDRNIHGFRAKIRALEKSLRSISIEIQEKKRILGELIKDVTWYKIENCNLHSGFSISAFVMNKVNPFWWIVMFMLSWHWQFSKKYVIVFDLCIRKKTKCEFGYLWNDNNNSELLPNDYVRKCNKKGYFVYTIFVSLMSK